MNAIKLPVTAYASANFDRLWSVRDGDRKRLCRDLTEEQAQQIALALNFHDALVEAMGFYGMKPEDCRNRVDPLEPGTSEDWLAEIGHDEGKLARAALAKVEDLRKNMTHLPESILNATLMDSGHSSDRKRSFALADTNDGWCDLRIEIDTDDCDRDFALMWKNRIINCVNACKGIEDPLKDSRKKV